MPGKVQQCNCVTASHTLFSGSSVSISHAYRLIDKFMASNFPFFWPRDLLLTEQLIEMTKHNTLYAIQNGQLQVPKSKLYKKLLIQDDKLKHMDLQTMLFEEDTLSLSPHKENEEDDRERQTIKNKDKKTVEGGSHKDGSMEEIKGLLNHILRETSGNSEMVRKNSLRIDALFARNQHVHSIRRISSRILNKL